MGDIASVPIALSDVHLGAALSTACRLHDAFRAVLLHLFKRGSASFYGKRSAFSPTPDRLEADHRQLRPHLALHRVGYLRHSHIDLRLGGSIGVAQINFTAE